MNALVAAISDDIAFDSIGCGRLGELDAVVAGPDDLVAHEPMAPAAGDSQAAAETQPPAVADLLRSRRRARSRTTRPAYRCPRSCGRRNRARIPWSYPIRALRTPPSPCRARPRPARPAQHRHMRLIAPPQSFADDWMGTTAMLSRHIASTRRKRLRRMMETSYVSSAAAARRASIATSILGAIQTYGHGERPVNRQCAGFAR